MKKALGETQTLRAGCSKAEPKLFALPQTPSRRHGTAKILSTADGHYLYLQTQFNMHAISSYRGNRPTNKQTNTATNPHTGPITIHCAAASAQCNKKNTKHKIVSLQFVKKKT